MEMKRAMKMHAKHVTLAVLATAGTLAAGTTPSALAASTAVGESTSANWAGYVAQGSSSGAAPQFSSVAGSWVEPSTDCSSDNGDAAFWVGLGGASGQSGALEQVGTQVDCSSGGSGQHFAWYELVPAAPVRLNLSITPGDHVSARVSVTGTAVTVSLSDLSTGATATKTLQMDDPDVSSAEWVAEAPSLCQSGDATSTGDCTPLSLADFGTVTFTGASATANGTTDTISSSNWSAQAVQLSGASVAQAGYPGIVDSSTSATASAAPSSLSTDGSSFSVAWQSAGSQSASSSYPGDPPGGYVPGYGGYGYGYGGYGYGGYGGYGYGGYGDPYSVYGSGGGASSYGPVGY
jgi:Peptidase A4 family